MNDKMVEVGKFYQALNDIVGSNLPLQKIYCSRGLRIHIIKQKHFDCLRHIDDIPDIISSPDYVGVNPNETGDTIELIKTYNKNILIGIKLNINADYLYVSTMYTVQESKLKRRLFSGRLKIFNNNINK